MQTGARHAHPLEEQKHPVDVACVFAVDTLMTAENNPNFLLSICLFGGSSAMTGYNSTHHEHVQSQCSWVKCQWPSDLSE